MATELQATYFKPAELRRKDEVHAVQRPLNLLERVPTIGQRGISMPRYKGLGETNPSPLWETTLDPEARSLLQVKVDHAEEADNVFETLIGHLVQPRPDLTHSNSLKVGN